jgi:ABC-type Mn2+/Zn2+ transport system ATPase subunit
MPRDEADIILRATALSLAYNQKPILRAIDFEIRRGDICFLLGPNGTGKTTLLRAILGVLQPRSGELWLHPTHATRQGIGFVPQRSELNPALSTTVREFVLLGNVGARIDRREERERLQWALTRAGLGPMGTRDYWSLSGGERQRALLARALVRRPTFLILDEPTANLDVWAEGQLLEVLVELNRVEHLSLLVVTHDLELAARHATRVALLRGGSLTSGPPEEMLRAETVAQLFGVQVGSGRR